MTDLENQDDQYLVLRRRKLKIVLTDIEMKNFLKLIAMNKGESNPGVKKGIILCSMLYHEYVTMEEKLTK
ncbi:hypothetical protein JCM13991_13360 [Thermodesulfovibrio hydrogeniphilus]